MLKLVIFWALGIFIFQIATAEYPTKTPSADAALLERIRSYHIAAMKNLFENITKEMNLTCENYLSYCTKNKLSDSRSDYKKEYSRILCEVGIKGYLCDNAKNGEAFVKLHDKVLDTRGYVTIDLLRIPQKDTDVSNVTSINKTRSDGIARMKSYFEMKTKENNLTCDNYLEYCVHQYTSDDDERSNFRILCEVGIKGYLCDNAKDGEAFAQLYDKVSGYIYDNDRGHGPFGPAATATQPPPTKSPY